MQQVAERCDPRIFGNSRNCAVLPAWQVCTQTESMAALFHACMQMRVIPSQPRLMQPTWSAQKVTPLSTSIMLGCMQQNHQSASKGLCGSSGGDKPTKCGVQVPRPAATR
jgi:hypothetical protein